LAAETEFPKQVRLRTDALELRFNDRLETPNTPEADAELRPAVEQALNQLFGHGEYALKRLDEAQSVYGFTVRARSADRLDALLSRVSASAI
jgi:hypothetical protein